MADGADPRGGGRGRGPVRSTLPHARPGPKEAVDREIRHHIEEKVDRLLEQGLDAETARREAERSFGDVERLRAEVEAVDRRRAPLTWLASAVESAVRDLHLALRSARREPWFALAVTATLGVGMGATVAIFSVVEAVLLRPLPFAEPERIVYMHELTARGATYAVSPANYLDWREGLSSFEAMAATSGESVLVTEGGDPERVFGARVSLDYFRVIGVQPFLGRAFSPEEDVRDGPRVAVVSHTFWSARLGSDPDAVGRTIRLNSEPHTVIGVMPQGVRAYTLFYGAEPVEVWRPYPFANDPPTERSARRLGAMGRLREGTTAEQAEAELKALASALSERYPEASQGWSAILLPLPEAMRVRARTPVLMLFGAVAFMLLIACLNVGSLFFARADVRRTTVTVRRALGASRAAVVRQLLAESLVLSGFGAALGIGITWALVPVLVTSSPIQLTRMGAVEINQSVLAFAGILAVMTAVLTSLLPAIGTSAPDLVEELKQGGRGRTEGRRARTANSFLVVAEVALSAILVVGAGLMLGSYLRLSGLELGFEPNGVIRVGALLPRDRYAEPVGRGTLPQTENFTLWRPRPEEIAFMEGVEERLSRLPGVESVAAGNFDPLPGRVWGSPVRVEGSTPPDLEDEQVAMRPVSPRWFQTLEIPIVRGRALGESDRRGSEDVVVLDESAAERLWPDRDPIGQRVLLSDGEEDPERPFRVVGIAADARQAIFDNRGDVIEDHLAVAYIPYRRQSDAYVDWQVSFRMRSVFLVRTNREIGDIAPEIREVIASFDAELPVTIDRLTDTVASPLADRRFYMGILVVFALLTLLLVASGVFAVMAYSVTRKTRELGIRLTLGARAAQLKRAELARGLRLAVLGILIGGVGAAWLSRFIVSFLYGVTTVEPVVYSLVAVVILVVVLAAAYLPAQRAARSDPMTSLRME